MAHAVRMPKPGQMTEECVLSMWRVPEGAPVAKGDIIFEIETDKASMEVESFHDGILLRQVVPAGAVVPVNEVCAWIGAAGEEIPAMDGTGPEAGAAASPGPALLQPLAPEPSQPPAAAAQASPTPAAAARDERPVPHGGARIAISPRAQARALEAGLDVRALRGTGPGGRIVERDVEAAVAVVAPASISSGDEEAPRPLSRMRRVIAERLTLSATTIPTFTATVAADVTRVLAVRDELRADGVAVSVNDIVLAATAQTLAEFPDVNSRTDGVQVWPRPRVHLGVAVALPAGLVVAVIHDADRRSVLDIHAEATRLVAAARDGVLPVDAMTGSTFTVTNLGMYGVDAFSAIINPGESGILAVAAAKPTPVVMGGGITIRTLMKLTLTADHRLVDGELGARFLGALRRRLEDPSGLEREVASA